MEVICVVYQGQSTFKGYFLSEVMISLFSEGTIVALGNVLVYIWVKERKTRWLRSAISVKAFVQNNSWNDKYYILVD